jgi:cell division protein FtsQ
MARKASPTIVQEELPYASESVREDFDDPRLVDLDVEEQSPFLRGQKRISARRGSISRKNFNYLKWAAIAAVLLCAAGLTGAGLYEYGQHSWRFRIESSDNIEITGTQNVSKARVMEVMGADIGRNIFFVPLGQQKEQLEQIPWVESASVMRFVPNRLRVEIRERNPVAFARVGPRIQLIDANGVLMELPPRHKYSFPVILGMNPGEPVSTRAPRMKTYTELTSQLDSGGAHYSHDLSEVDLSDPEDTKVRVNDPAGDVLVQLGSSNFAERYKLYLTHIQGWRQQFQKVESVDLRYENQIIVNPEFEHSAHEAALSAASARAAVAAGVVPAAMVTRMAAVRPAQRPVFGPQALKRKPKTSHARRKSAKTVQARATYKKPAPAGPRTQAGSTVAKASPQAQAPPAATAGANAAGRKPSAGVAKAPPISAANQSMANREGK